ncbi:UNVERIFIED_ORG: xanthine dehydrogenase accessory factor [Rhizobium sp. SORGH_AS260]|jgi:xanthine dehydrogenase accessory factor|uniref:XdhC family protein n=1 Tax=Agrobacterium TaxID=357 RepID=UPI0011515B6E|nr:MULTISPECIES: XdhC family protein [Agrobacterium]MDP9734551.1 xanthine dehydrogenase accessory factor [Rhizobium sp. SORGH_AS_0285]MDP9756769.1 xanthine dehydrogenase accessory factor [Rhizobium sp. SORGH_AS_0260]MDR6083980.1 xanthine dehydrogenase accessory factor [Agrobacterium sp. SORGH_AS_0440]
MDVSLVTALNSVKARRIPVVEIINLATGSQELLTTIDGIDSAVADAARQALAGGLSYRTEIDGVPYFLNVHLPAIRLMIIGAVHIAQALAPMASQAGMETIVVDPREAFATEDRFPGVAVLPAWPDEAFKEISVDANTAMVALTHDPKIDDPAVKQALRAGTFYIGALGSSRTHLARLERLRAAGFEQSVLERIRGPIGLDIGAREPGEIAVAILAEIIAHRRSRYEAGKTICSASLRQK